SSSEMSRRCEMPARASRQSVMYSAFAGMVRRTTRGSVTAGTLSKPRGSAPGGGQGRPLAEDDRDRLVLVPTQDGEARLLSGLQPLAHEADDVAAAANQPAVDGHDDVPSPGHLRALEAELLRAGSQAGALAGAVRLHTGDERPRRDRDLEEARKRRREVIG